MYKHWYQISASLRRTLLPHTIILLFCCLLFLACENTQQQINKLTAKGLNVEEAKNITINYTTNGNAKAQLKAPTMLRVQDTSNYVEFPKTIHVDFFNQATVIESILDAKYGKYLETQSKVQLKDSVRFIGLANGDTLYTDELFWDRNRLPYQFYTDKPFIILTKKEIIRGVGIEVNEGFTDKLFKNITNSIFRIPTSQFPQY